MKIQMFNSDILLEPKAQAICYHIIISVLPKRIYNSHYGNGVPAMFTS